jgi:hypothetical protein
MWSLPSAMFVWLPTVPSVSRELISPRTRVILEKLTFAQFVKVLPSFYSTRRFITVLTRARHRPISWARCTPSQPVSPRSFLILSFHLRLGLPSSLSRPNRLWNPLSRLFNEHRVLFPRAWGVRGMKVATHLHLVRRLKVHGAIPTLPHTSSWRGAQLSKGYDFMLWFLVKHTDNFTFTFPCVLHAPPISSSLTGSP